MIEELYSQYGQRLMLPAHVLLSPLNDRVACRTQPQGSGHTHRFNGATELAILCRSAVWPVQPAFGPWGPPVIARGSHAEITGAAERRFRGQVRPWRGMSVQGAAAAGTAAACPLALLRGYVPCSSSKRAMSSWA